MKPATVEPLYTCPVCRQPNFSRRGLRAHCCHAKPGRARLTAYELIKAAVRKVPACEPATSVSQSQPMSNSPKKHALALVAQPEWLIGKDALKKLQVAAVAEMQTIHRLQCEAAGRAVLVGLALHRIKASLKHGQWGGWINRDFKAVGHRQVNYYMRLALVFLERERVQKPDLLALPGDQLALDVEGDKGGAAFVNKLQKFVGDLSLTELLIKHGIKGVGLKTELTTGEDDEGDELTPEQQAQQERDAAWLAVWNPAQAIRATLTDPNKLQLISDPAKVEQLKAEIVELNTLIDERLAALRAVKI